MIANNAKINCIFRALIRSSIFCDCRFIDTPYTCSEQREPKVKLRFPRRCPWKGSRQSLPWKWEQARSFQSSIQSFEEAVQNFQLKSAIRPENAFDRNRLLHNASVGRKDSLALLRDGWIAGRFGQSIAILISFRNWIWWRFDARAISKLEARFVETRSVENAEWYWIDAFLLS